MSVRVLELPDRFGLIGDVHAEDALLERALDALAAEGIETILCTGDIADGPGSVERCVQLLRDRNVLVVRGNHDRWLVSGFGRDLPDATPSGAVDRETHSYLASLPATRTLSTRLGPGLLCHGLGANDMGGVRPDDSGYALEANTELQGLLRDGRCRLVLSGHTHRAMVRQFDELAIVNAGTLARRDEACFLDVDLRKQLVRVHGFGSDGATMLRHELSLGYGPWGDSAFHVAFGELERALDRLEPPRDDGVLELIVARHPRGQRETPERIRLCPERGVPGDAWERRDDAAPEAQVTVMRADVARLFANGQPLTLFGDNLLVDLELSLSALPEGSRVQIGQAELEVTPKPHTGCAKFRQRFGGDALRLTADPRLRELRLRGVHMKVSIGGEVAVGDRIRVLRRG